MAILESSDFTAGASPNYGFSSPLNNDNGDYYTRTLRETGGPAGQGAMEWAWIVKPSGSNQITWGFRSTGLSLPSNGASLYCRFKFKIGTGFYAGDDNGDPAGEPWGGKLVILTATADSDRPMVLMAPRVGLSDQSIRATKNISGASYTPPDEGSTDYASVTIGSWNYYQCEWRFATNGSSADGYIKHWLNATGAAHVYASPTDATAADIQMDPPNGQFDMGTYSPYLRLNGVCVITYCDIELADTFATTWGSGVGASASAGAPIFAAVF